MVLATYIDKISVVSFGSPETGAGRKTRLIGQLTKTFQNFFFSN
jgi:hypothetical protein